MGVPVVSELLIDAESHASLVENDQGRPIDLVLGFDRSPDRGQLHLDPNDVQEVEEVLACRAHETPLCADARVARHRRSNVPAVDLQLERRRLCPLIEADGRYWEHTRTAQGG